MTPVDQLQLSKLPDWSLIGCLLYLAISMHPNISYTIQQLLQYFDSYTFKHRNVAIRLVHYLKVTRDIKLHLRGNNPIMLLTYSDLDWANCLDTHWSIGGYVCTLGSGVLSWTACKQKVVAMSSCEAEYIVAFKTTKECIWICTFLMSHCHWWLSKYPYHYLMQQYRKLNPYGFGHFHLRLHPCQMNFPHPTNSHQ